MWGFEQRASATIPLLPAIMSPPSWWLMPFSNCELKLNFLSLSQVYFIGELYHSNRRKTKTCLFLCREVKERIPQDLLAVTGNIFRHAQPFKCDTMLLSTKHTPEKCSPVTRKKKSQKCLILFSVSLYFGVKSHSQMLWSSCRPRATSQIQRLV